MSGSPPIPLTVIGGYLGAGKTTLVNSLLRSPGGRRIAVIVNDFGSVAIDADLLRDADVDGGVIGLANGCVCCAVVDGLHEALGAIQRRDPRPDHVVIEVSGIADPSVAAAWGRVPPFVPGGVVVVAAANDVLARAGDRYVGADVARQLAGADLVVVTKADLVAPHTLEQVYAGIDELSGGAPRIDVVNGVVSTDLLLGALPAPRSSASPHDHPIRPHHADYDAWEVDLPPRLDRAGLHRIVAELPDRVLRAKGIVTLADGSSVLVQRVGRRVELLPTTLAPTPLVAIAPR